MARGLPQYPELSGCDALVPVPIHPKRRRERGWNQAEILAEEVGASTGTPIIDVLERVKSSSPSWRLSHKERQTQLANTFRAKSSIGTTVSGKKLMLIDDVCASATTLEECALALRRAGASDVVGYVFARS
jgi:ComF family protein